MLKTLTLVLLMTIGFALPAQAAPVPQQALDQDYQSCMSSGDQAQDQQQLQQYCSCIRDQISGWDMDTYTQVLQQTEATDPKNPPPSLNQLAQTCIAKTLKQ